MEKKVIKAWAGIVEDSIHVEKDRDVYDEPRFAIFPTKKAAARAYECVRRVEIRLSQ